MTTPQKQIITTAEEQTDENASPLHDLTRFQEDLLVAIARLEATGELPIGLDVKTYLENRYGTSINHGRLYPNLKSLEMEKGLITRSQKDKRSQTISLTSRGYRELDSLQSWVKYDGNEGVGE